MENKQENELTQCIYNLENMLNSQSHDHENIMKQLFEKQEQLNEIRQTKLNGHILRSKAIKIENNEKNTKYFANLEKKHAEKR